MEADATYDYRALFAASTLASRHGTACVHARNANDDIVEINVSGQTAGVGRIAPDEARIRGGRDPFVRQPHLLELFLDEFKFNLRSEFDRQVQIGGA